MKTSNESPKLPQDASPSEVKDGRRRLLKIGATVAPIVLTLSSRSALACHCRSPSAGGSVTFNSHRPTTGGWQDDGFHFNSGKTFSGWMNSSGSLPGSVTKDTKLKDIPYLKTSSLFSANKTKIKDLSPGFKQDIVTAYLNLNFIPSVQGECLTLVKLQAMASGTYSDPADNIIGWDQSQIRTYLRVNYLLG